MNADNYFQRLASDTSTQQALFTGSTREDVEQWQQTLRPQLKRKLGIDRIAARVDGPPSARLIDSVTCEDHVREDWIIETEPGYDMPFFLLRPHSADGPLPLAITPHGHGRNSRHTYAGAIDNDPKVIDGERDVALQAVRNGYIAIAPEARAFGESRTREDKQRDCTSSCSAWQTRALLLGRTLIGERTWDICRLIDFAQTHDQIDTRRVLVTGNSGGGTITLFAAMLDTRISLAIPSCYVCTFEASIGRVKHCPCNAVPGLMDLGDMGELAGLIAPRTLRIVAGASDPIFPIEGAKQAYEQALRTYQAAGVPERCQLVVGEGGHRYYKQLVWPFVAEHDKAINTDKVSHNCMESTVGPLS